MTISYELQRIALMLRERGIIDNTIHGRLIGRAVAVDRETGQSRTEATAAAIRDLCKTLRLLL